MTQDLAQRIRDLAREAGYVACGFVRAEPFAEYAQALDDRARRFPAAAPLYEGLRQRVDPCGGKPWVRSLIVCVRRYGHYIVPPGLDAHIGRNYLFDQRAGSRSRGAPPDRSPGPAADSVPSTPTSLPAAATTGCPDAAMPGRLTAGLKALGLRVVRGGVPDRWAAALAGVARIGRNSFAYCGAYGSWVNIATWRTDADLPADTPTLDCPCPPDCRACQEACPTAAIAEPYVVRMDHCVAYLTYGAPEPPDPALAARMGPWVYGCDVCQRVCPLNHGAWAPLERAEWLERVVDRLTPEALADMDAETYRDVVLPLFWYLGPDGLARWRTNARRALAAGAPAPRPGQAGLACPRD